MSIVSTNRAHYIQLAKYNFPCNNMCQTFQINPIQCNAWRKHIDLFPTEAMILNSEWILSNCNTFVAKTVWNPIWNSSNDNWHIIGATIVIRTFFSGNFSIYWFHSFHLIRFISASDVTPIIHFDRFTWIFDWSSVSANIVCFKQHSRIYIARGESFSSISKWFECIERFTTQRASILNACWSSNISESLLLNRCPFSCTRANYME